MIRFYLLTLLSLTIGYPLFAQTNETQAADTAWKKGGDISINFNRVGLNNWAGGGQSSLSLGTIFNLFSNYEKGKDVWENKFQAAYGLIREGDNDLLKSDDLLLLESKYGRKISERWLYTALASFRTQFDEGFEFNDDGSEGQKTSQFLAPAYLQAALGMTYRNKDFKYAFTLSPITGKFTIVTQDELRQLYGVDEDKTIRSELGASFDASVKREILENVNFESNLNLFSSYENAANIDVNWTVLLLLKVNKYITSSVATTLIYDDDTIVEKDDGTMGRAIQFKNVINVGFAYQFGQ